VVKEFSETLKKSLIHYQWWSKFVQKAIRKQIFTMLNSRPLKK
jgi:hypothetical protein